MMPALYFLLSSSRRCVFFQTVAITCTLALKLTRNITVERVRSKVVRAESNASIHFYETFQRNMKFSLSKEQPKSL